MITKETLRKLMIASVIIVSISLLAYLLRGDKQSKTDSVKQEKTMALEDRNTKEQGSKPSIDIKRPNSQYVLVNKSFPISPIDYKPGDLVVPDVQTSPSDPKDEQSIRKLVKPSIEKMMGDARGAKLDLVMNSGFRSYRSQGVYFNNYVKQSGLEAAKKFSAEPGHSEHQTGLAFDLSYKDKNCYLDICFSQTDAGEWLAEHAHEYGFILRYPDGKTDITGYQYEPWHFRYVGEDIAKDIFEKKLTYEEYLKKKGLLAS